MMRLHPSTLAALTTALVLLAGGVATDTLYSASIDSLAVTIATVVVAQVTTLSACRAGLPLRRATFLALVPMYLILMPYMQQCLEDLTLAEYLVNVGGPVLVGSALVHELCCQLGLTPRTP